MGTVTRDIKGTPRSGLIGGTLGFFVGFAAVALFGPSAKKFSEVMELTPLLVGLLIAAPNLSGSLLRIPFGAWVDSTGGRKPFLALLLASIVGMGGLTWFVFARYPDGLTGGYYWLLFLLGVLCGCGIATFSVGIGQVSYWFPQSRQGAALGTYAGVGNLAPGMFSFLLPVSLGVWGLANSYLAWFVFLVVGTVLYYVTGANAPFFQYRRRGVSPDEAKARASEAGQELFPRGNAAESLKGAGKNWRTWALTVIYFASFGGFLALTAWFPTYWAMRHGHALKTAGLLTALYSLTCSIIRVPGGGLSDRLGGERTLMLSLMTMGGGAIVMTVAHSTAVAVVGELVLALGMGVCNAAVFKLVPRHIEQAVGGGAGFVGGLGAFGGFAIPPVMGLFVKTLGVSGYSLGFIVFIVLAAVSLASTGLLQRSRRAATLAPAPANPGPPNETPKMPASRGRPRGHLQVAAVISIVVTALGVAVLYNPKHYAWIGDQTGYAPPQPVEFSHKLHAKDNSIPCEYCHFSARRGPVAGIPPAQVCMNCHSEVRKDSPEVEKVADAIESGRPIEWVRVYDVPDFVYFDHSAHVNKGIECQTCHGPVEEMARVEQARHLNMGWCVECHRQYMAHPPEGIEDVAASSECSVCHF